MATEEYLNKFIAGGKRYAELPDRFKLTVTEEDWRRRWVLGMRRAVGNMGAFVAGLPHGFVGCQAGRNASRLPALLSLSCCMFMIPRSVKDYCIERGFSWAVTVANTVCNEQACRKGCWLGSLL